MRAGSTSMKKVLFIIPRLPEYDRASGDLRLYRILEMLSRQHTVVVCNDGTWDRFLKHGDTQYLDALTRLGIGVWKNPEEMDENIQKCGFDVVVCQFYAMALKYIDKVRQYFPESFLIVDSVDVFFYREQMMATVMNDPVLNTKAQKTKNEELTAYRQADCVWVVNKHDEEILQKEIPLQQFFVVPNIHKIPESTPPQEVRVPNTLVFVGGFLHQPNVDAMLYFCSEILPLIRAKVADVKLFIVGDSPPDKIKALANEAVAVVGYVPETKAYLDQSMVSIAPLRFGAGMKGKVGEAFAEGIPVVTTPVGVQGMNLIHRQDCFITETPQAFAEAVVELLSDSDLWYRMSSNGRRYMKKYLSYEAMEENLLRFFDSLSADNSAQAREVTPTKASVVFLTKNGGKKLKESLDAVFSQVVSFSFEVVIVDSGSTDETLDIVKNYPVKLFTIPPEKFNFGLTRDYGFQVARGEIVIAISQDAVPADRDWLSNMVEPFNDGNIAVVQGSAEFPPDETVFYWEKVKLLYFTRESRGWSTKNGGIGMSFVNCAIRRKIWEENQLGAVEMSEDKVFQKMMTLKKYKIMKQPHARCMHTHEYNLITLMKRCENEGLGWKFASVQYRFTDMIRDLMNKEVWKAWKNGIQHSLIKTRAELFFPLVRPLFVYKGNQFTRKYVR